MESLDDFSKLIKDNHKLRKQMLEELQGDINNYQTLNKEQFEQHLKSIEKVLSSAEEDVKHFIAQNTEVQKQALMGSLKLYLKLAPLLMMSLVVLASVLVWTGWKANHQNQERELLAMERLKTITAAITKAEERQENIEFLRLMDLRLMTPVEIQALKEISENLTIKEEDGRTLIIIETSPQGCKSLREPGREVSCYILGKLGVKEAR